MSISLPAVKRALISVSDKSQLVEFAQALHALDIALISTGGSAKALAEAGIPVTKVSDITEFPEIMEGRVKTLHPKIHGGILARRDVDATTLDEHAIAPIDLVVVNLYPFEKTISGHHTLSDAIENIDIGGPCMIRAAAKNHAWVGVVVDPEDYDTVITTLKTQGGLDDTTRQHLAQKAFTHTAHYDTAISHYLAHAFSPKDTESLPERFAPEFSRLQTLRYGENPQQTAALYAQATPHTTTGTIAHATILQGKALSYNNLADADAAFSCVQAFETPACVIVKHANPCGVALAEDFTQAYQRAFVCDKTSAFGGIIAFNGTVDAKTARAILDNQFVEVVIGTAIADDALAIFAEKPNVRVLATGKAAHPVYPRYEMKAISGGVLVQTFDAPEQDISTFKIVSKRHPTETEMQDLLFAWRVCHFVKSNAIVYGKDLQTAGVGAGQMSRVFSASIAAEKAQQAGLSLKQAVMASDAFFPFRDGIDTAATHGISAVIHPGGSIRDEEIIQAADEHDMAMVMTGIRHFKH